MNALKILVPRRLAFFELASRDAVFFAPYVVTTHTAEPNGLVSRLIPLKRYLALFTSPYRHYAHLLTLALKSFKTSFLSASDSFFTERVSQASSARVKAALSAS